MTDRRREEAGMGVVVEFEIVVVDEAGMGAVVEAGIEVVDDN